MIRHWLGFIVVAGALAGCAGNKVPPAISEPPPANPSVNEVQANPDSYIGRAVRWGGTIAGVDNRAEETCVEVVARPLQDNGRPRKTDTSEGRFLACIPGFLDPVIYAKDRQLTVSGKIAAAETRQVGRFPYRYPVVQVDTHRLWQPEPPPTRVEEDPFWYYPWPGYYPYYPYSPWYAPPLWRPR